MTILLGRLPLVESNISWSESGSALDISGLAVGDKLDAEQLRQRLQGYVDSPDESFVPLVWDSEPVLQGYYRVLSADVRGDGSDAFRGIVRWSVRLMRVTGFSAPLVELRALGTTRVNTGSLTSTQAICVPGAAKSVAFLSSGGSYIPFSPDHTRVGSRGPVLAYQLGGSPYTTQFYIEPGSFYDGAATLLMGDSLATVVGRQVPSTPTAWRISNGLFEIEPDGTADFSLRIRMFLDGTFTDWVSFTMLGGAFAGSRYVLPAPHSITVLRNSPEEVAIRLLSATPGGYSPFTLDISLKRGSRWAAFELHSVFSSRFAVRCSAFSGATYVGTHYYWKALTSPTRMIIAGPQRVLQSSTDVHPYQASVVDVEDWAFMIGLVDGSGTDNYDDALSEYMWAGSSKQAVVVQ